MIMFKEDQKQIHKFLEKLGVYRLLGIANALNELNIVKITWNSLNKPQYILKSFFKAFSEDDISIILSKLNNGELDQFF